jgi:AGZA family xanthine/uracil permease-like MFS transporter
VFPFPTLGFLAGLGRALGFLPIAFPFALLTIVGGINVTESARVAGDRYQTRDILLTEAIATMVAALFGGVAQSTPYIGHPAYKAMGGRAAYTLATGLFVGIGGALGIISFVVEAIPEAAITPILMFVGIEIVSQAFVETPSRHAPAVAFATIPVVAYLVLINLDGVVGKLGPAVKLPETLVSDQVILRAAANGFVLTAMLWGALLADLLDGRLKRASLYGFICALFSFFGVIHSVSPAGDVYLPWNVGNALPWQIALGYGVMAVFFCVASRQRRSG